MGIGHLWWRKIKCVHVGGSFVNQKFLEVDGMGN